MISSPRTELRRILLVIGLLAAATIGLAARPVVDGWAHELAAQLIGNTSAEPATEEPSEAEQATEPATQPPKPKETPLQAPTYTTRAAEVVEPVVSPPSTPSSPTAQPQPTPAPIPAPDPEPASRYHLVLKTPSGEQRLAHETTGTITVLRLLEQFRDQDALTLSTQQYDFGVLITAINGIENNSATNEFWVYYVNGASPPVGADQYQLKARDVVLWEYKQI